ncbi:MAG TPA: hypothetical protein VMS17_28765 [Gemmataceae bacterium]|nr:hypothetical protein [Gemmataceae bacterium]
MTPQFPHLVVERRADVFCVRPRSARIEEGEIPDLATELIALAESAPCRGVALSLGPQPLECLYSVFLAKLYWVQRVLSERGVALVLCEAPPAVRSIFEAVKLDDRFRFAADFNAAVADLTA